MKIIIKAGFIVENKTVYHDVIATIHTHHEVLFALSQQSGGWIAFCPHTGAGFGIGTHKEEIDAILSACKTIENKGIAEFNKARVYLPIVNKLTVEQIIQAQTV